MVYFLSMAGFIACKDASPFEAFSCPSTPSSTVYKRREIERREFVEGIRIRERLHRRWSRDRQRQGLGPVDRRAREVEGGGQRLNTVRTLLIGGFLEVPIAVQR